MSRTFKIVQINNKAVNRGRYTTNSSPSSVAKKVFSRLYSEMKTKLKTFMIKETTQGSSKKVYGPYKGRQIKLRKPRMVKFKGTKELVPIRYDTKIYKVKNNHKKNIYKGGILISRETINLGKGYKLERHLSGWYVKHQSSNTYSEKLTKNLTEELEEAISSSKEKILPNDIIQKLIKHYTDTTKNLNGIEVSQTGMTHVESKKKEEDPYIQMDHVTWSESNNVRQNN
jgi:predicted house-cleaning noncanonical NTP pyrophosphatase (MazG superfamily)